jgi:hypothetical protein
MALTIATKTPPFVAGRKGSSSKPRLRQIRNALVGVEVVGAALFKDNTKTLKPMTSNSSRKGGTPFPDFNARNRKVCFTSMN